ncbi:hypothetical protein L9F63_018447, partial [Diploptera punctata]
TRGRDLYPRERNPVVLNREISGATRLVLPYQSNGQGKCCPKSCSICGKKNCSSMSRYVIRTLCRWSITLALSSAESPFSQTIKSKNEKRIFVPSTDRIRNLVHSSGPPCIRMLLAYKGRIESDGRPYAALGPNVDIEIDLRDVVVGGMKCIHLAEDMGSNGS